MPTTLQIKSAKPAERDYKLADTGGLFVLVQPNGSKLWRYKFRLDGVEGLQALGAFPEVTLADARSAHTESRRLVAKGVHPVQARRDERESRAHAELHRVKGSFGAVCAEWNAATGADLRPATVLQRNREIEKDLTPRFKDRPISKIARLELTTALKEVEARAPEVARNLRNYLWGIFEYAIDSGLIADNPVPPVRVLRKRNRENHLALSPDLLGEFLRKLVAIDTIHEQTRIAMLLVVLTACRKAEVTGGKWSEIDLNAADWEIPADRMKAGRAHWVPLSRQCVKLLQELRALVPEGGVYLFPNRLDPDRPMADRSLNALMERLGFSGGRAHGVPLRPGFTDSPEPALARSWAAVDALWPPRQATSTLEKCQKPMHTSDNQGTTVSNLAQQVLAHAASMPEGASLSAKALLHLGSRAAVDQALSRLARSGELLRAGRGLYVLPVKGKFGARAPEVAKVVQEWASQRGETVVGNGAAAANALGLTTQVPVRQVFLTSGRSRKLKLGAQTVELKHAPPWQLLYPGQAAGEVIRSLAWVGPSGSEAALGQLRQRLPASELLAVANARARLPTWLASQVSSLLIRA